MQHGKANIDSFNTVREDRLLNSSFLWTWTGLRQAIPINQRTHHLLSVLFLIAKALHDVTTIVFSIKCNYEKPKKWAKKDQHIAEAFLLPIRIFSEPYLRTFQYKVLKSILFSNDTFQVLTVPFASIPQKLETMYCLVAHFQTL